MRLQPGSSIGDMSMLVSMKQKTQILLTSANESEKKESSKLNVFCVTRDGHDIQWQGQEILRSNPVATTAEIGCRRRWEWERWTNRQQNKTKQNIQSKKVCYVTSVYCSGSPCMVHQQWSGNAEGDDRYGSWCVVCRNVMGRCYCPFLNEVYI